jgi:amino acid transporter
MRKNNSTFSIQGATQTLNIALDLVNAADKAAEIFEITPKARRDLKRAIIIALVVAAVVYIAMKLKR